MEKKIDDKLIKEFNDIWHFFIFSFQNKSYSLWGDDLKDATTIEISILNMIDNKSDVLLKEIKEKLQIPGSTLTSAIDRLEKKGLITRTISERDRRSYGLQLTDRGEKAQKIHIKAENELFEQILGSLDSNAECFAFLNSLKKIKKRLNRQNR